MSTIQIRKAQAKESEQIARVHVQSWQETYTGIVNQAYLDELSVEQRERMWRYYLAHDQAHVFVAVEQATIVGFCSTELRNQPHENSPFLGALYLLKNYHGRGLGKQLFLTALEQLKADQQTKMYLDVVKENPTLHFYEKFGGKVIAEKTIDLNGQKLQELVLEYSL